MPYFSDWGTLTAAAQLKCNKILGKDIAKAAKRIVQSHAQSDIYGAYSPKPNAWVGGSTYSRRHTLTGTIYSEYTKPNEIMVTSKAAPSPAIIKGYSFHNRRPGMFFKLLESGNIGIWKGGFLRPAITNAQNEINGGALDAVIQSALDREF